MAVLDREATYGRITDEALAELRGRIGKEYAIEDPFVRYVNADSIRHAARAIGDMNPLWINRDHASTSRYGKLVAPPAIFYAAAWGSWDMRRGEGLPGVHSLHCGDHWFFHHPVVEGLEISAIKSLVAADAMQGKWAGRSVMQVREFKFFDQGGTLLARQIMPAVRGEREASRSLGKYDSIPKAKYTPDEIAQIDSEIGAEEVRGSNPRYWEDVEVGEHVQPLIRGPLTVADMIAWMMGIGSPHIRSGQYWLAYRRQSPKVAVPDPTTGILEPVERVHWDNFMAAEIGMPSAYDYGAQRGAWATHFMTNWAGDDGFLGELDVQFRGFNFLGDTLRIRGDVVETWRGAKTGTGYVKCSLTGINQRGDVIMPGHAIVALPSRDEGPIAFPVDVVADGRR